ncbi:hypothetical protein GCM10023063_22170 [Arthrobacter methylotrophus]
MAYTQSHIRPVDEAAIGVCKAHGQSLQGPAKGVNHGQLQRIAMSHDGWESPKKRGQKKARRLRNHRPYGLKIHCGT